VLNTKHSTYYNTSETNKDLKTIEFLAVLASLMGVIATLTPLNIQTEKSSAIKSIFGIFLVLFVLYSAIAYTQTANNQPRGEFYQRRVRTYFGFLLGFTLGIILAAQNALVIDPYVVFAATGSISGIFFGAILHVSGRT
jgi:hypothetical protein